jgi:hypothetical protein
VRECWGGTSIYEALLMRVMPMFEVVLHTALLASTNVGFAGAWHVPFT